MLSQKLQSAKTFAKEHNIEIGFGAFCVAMTALAVKYPEAFVEEAPKVPETIVHIYHHNV